VWPTDPVEVGVTEDVRGEHDRRPIADAQPRDGDVVTRRCVLDRSRPSNGRTLLIARHHLPDVR
jgi:hypothetical protein